MLDTIKTIKTLYKGLTMALPGNDAVLRFQENEDRFDKFINDIGGYIDKNGIPVESAQNLAANLVNLSSSDPSKGSSLVKFLPNAPNSIARNLNIKISEFISVTDFGAVGDGVTDDGPSIRIALASGKPITFPAGTYLTDHDLSSAFDDAGTTRYSYSLAIPSNAVLNFDQGSIIKQKSGAQKWTRTVVFQGVNNINIFGELRVDANVVNLGTPNNEHMHGVYFYNATDVYIERIDSQNARGDNIFIGGSDETTYSKNITIGSIFAKKAGRKNLTFHMVDALQIGIADLDNSTGGAAIYGGTADNTDKHSLDVEPDAYTGAKRFCQQIGILNTYGIGNDFTAGTTQTHADNWRVSIGTANCVQSASSNVKAWIQNGITVYVGSLSILNCAGCDNSVQLLYAARLIGNSFTVSGASAGASLVDIEMAGGDANRPEVSFNRIEVVNSNGSGITAKSAHLDAGIIKLTCSGTGLICGDNVSSGSNRGSINIGHLISYNTGVATTGAVIAIAFYSIAGTYLSIRRATQYDSRTPKAGYLIDINSGCAFGVLLGEVVSPESIVVAKFGGSDAYYRISGGASTTTPRQPAQFVCNGTPESMVSAAIGSTAVRLDGGASTTFYVKQSGTGNTGWVAK